MSASSQPQVYHVVETDTGNTLPALLRQWRPDLSWTGAKQLLKARQVSVNGATCLDEGRRVKAGDVVHIHPYPRTPQPTAEDVELLHWDEDLLVVIKPALMTTLRHAEERNWPAARRNLQPTLDEVLPQLLQRAESGGRRHDGSSSRQPPQGKRSPRDWQRLRREQRRPVRLPRVRPVHRLDRDTSGVMVFARTETAERKLIEQFKVHSIERRYLAIVHGRPEAQTIRSRLIRDRGDGLRGVTDSNTDGESAVTHIRPLESLGEYCLVECRLETGRTHQIRLHLSSLGHLVCGDPLYTRRVEAPPLDDPSGAPRLALHAARLAFVHPRYDEPMDFDVSLPADLERFVRRLRRDAQ